MAKRVYVVESKKGAAPRLVNATIGSSAIAHVAKQEYTARVAKQTDLIDIGMKKGVKIEEAGDFDDPAPVAPEA